MKLHTLPRAAMSVAAVAAVLALGATADVTLPTTAHAAAGVQLSAADTDTDTDPVVAEKSTLISAGEGGFLYQAKGGSGYLWHKIGNSDQEAVPALDGVPLASIAGAREEYDRVGYTSTNADGTTQATWVNISDGRQLGFTVPSGYQNPQLVNGVVVATVPAADGSGTPTYRIARNVSQPAPLDYPIALPAGATAESTPVILALYNTHFVIRWQQNGQAAYGYVDEITGAVSVLPVTGEASSFGVTSDWISWYSHQGTPGVRFLKADYPGALPGVLPLDTQSATSDVTVLMVGNNFVWYEGASGPLHLVPLVGPETPRTLVANAEQLMPSRDSDLYAIGTDADGNRAIYQITVDGSELVFSYPMQQLPAD